MPGSLRFAPFISSLLLCLCTAAALSAATVPPVARPAVSQVTSVYENATITEDLNLRGVVAVKGALTVAPQATLRIEPGTEIRFTTASGSSQLPRLVVMGRIQAAGTLDRPILLTSGSPLKKSAWGGVLLLSSEKRNQLEHCRIEGAEAALEGRFSNISLKNVSVTQSKTGLLLRDSTVSATGASLSDCETGVEAHDSELELRDSALAQNRRGAALFRSSVVMSSVAVTGNSQHGVLAEEGRIKMTSCDVTGNGVGAQFKGGEGQLFMCRFMRNIDAALSLAAARLKINRCQITENLRDGLKLADGRATVWGNSFSGNGGYNLVNSGADGISAPQNWWGAADEASVKSKIFDAALNGRIGAVNVFPWLLQKPALLP